MKKLTTCDCCKKEKKIHSIYLGPLSQSGNQLRVSCCAECAAILDAIEGRK